MFLASSADIALYGGAAGGGKTFALLLEASRHIDNPDYGAVIFRREAVQITSEGGLFDTSYHIYSDLGGTPRLSPRHSWNFESGATITFSHLHNQVDVNDWQGSQIPLIGYDELTHFTSNQFWYMLSRNRSICGVRPYIRATCNPDADSWVAELVDWYINPDSGYPIPDRSGVVRYFVRDDGKLHWAMTPGALLELFPRNQPKSFTFVPATLEDNQILLQNDPSYRSNLLNMNRVERERLLMGNWKIKPQMGSYFPRLNVQILPEIPSDVEYYVRRWDLAATEPSETNPSPSATAGILMGRRSNGRFIIVDGINFRKPAHIVRDTIRNVASQDKGKYKRVVIVLPQDPGQAGKSQVASLVSFLAGFNVKSVRETGQKKTRAEPLSAQWQAGNVDIVAGDWNSDFLREMESFPSAEHDDYVDATSGAFLECIDSADEWRRILALSS